jgi:hypothetical protein
MPRRKDQKSSPPHKRAFAPIDLYPGTTATLPRSESLAQLAEYALAMCGRLSEAASAMQAIENAAAPKGSISVYGPYRDPERPVKPVVSGPPPVLRYNPPRRLEEAEDVL